MSEDLKACGGCGQPIRWVETQGGRRMPLDSEPREDGNVYLLLDGRAAYLRQDQQDFIGDRYVSHFATCPAAGRFRRSR